MLYEEEETEEEEVEERTLNVNTLLPQKSNFNYSQFSLHI